MQGKILLVIRILSLPELIKTKGITDTISLSFCNRIISLLKDKGLLCKVSSFSINDSVYFTVDIKYKSGNQCSAVEFLLELLDIIQALQTIYKANADTFFLIDGEDLSEEEFVQSVDFLRKMSPLKYNKLKEGGVIFYETFLEEYERILRIFELIKKEKFVLYLQPVVDRKREIVFYEALSRLKGDKRVYSPAEFFETLENSDYYPYFEAWLYEESVKWARKLGKPISVNITGSIYFNIKNSLFLNHYCSPQELIYEISEKAVINDANGLKDMLNDLHNKGVRIYLDDFGSGVSGVYLLKEFPITAIKIDREFSILDDNKTYAIVKNLVNLCKDMNLQTCIEGIEKEEHFLIAKNFNINYYQGFLFSKPLEAKEFLYKEKSLCPSS